MLACPIASVEASPIAFAAVEEEAEVSAGFALPLPVAVDDFTAAAVVPDGSSELLQAFFLLSELSVSYYRVSHLLANLGWVDLYLRSS